MGKGSARRKEDLGKVWDNYDKIFGKKKKEPWVPPPLPVVPPVDTTQKTK